MSGVSAGSLQEPPFGLTGPGSAFYDLFKSLQDGTGMTVPPRKSMSLAACRSFAPYLSILEMREPMVALVRLIGVANVNRTRIDNTGKNWLDLFPLEKREPVWRAFRRILDTPRGSLVYVNENYERSILIEVLTFPFSDAHGAPRYIISTTTQVDMKDMDLRGEDMMTLDYPTKEYFLDIGAGAGAGEVN